VLVAYLEASGKTNREIAKRLGRSEAWVSTTRESVGYAEALQAAMKDISDRIAEEAVDLSMEFNREAKNSFDTVVEIRDGRDYHEGTRLKASLAILDRSSSAPQPRERGAGDNQTVVQIPVQMLENLRTTLVESGRDRVVELIDYSVKTEVAPGTDAERDQEEAFGGPISIDED
jgi:enoyl reductase-like protein